MLTDSQRHELYTAALTTWGQEAAEALMSLIPPDAWPDIARRSDVRTLGTELRGEMAELRGEMAELRGEIAELRGEIAEVRGEMAQLRAHVDAQLPKLITANIASMIGVAGLVLGAVSVA